MPQLEATERATGRPPCYSLIDRFRPVIGGESTLFVCIVDWIVTY